MEAPLPQPPQPGITSPPLRPKPTPPPRNPLHRKASLDGRPRPEGVGGPDSNPSSPPTSPQRVPGGGESVVGPTWGNRASGQHTTPQHQTEVRGAYASLPTSPQRELETSRSFANHQPPAETKDSASQATSPMQTVRSRPEHEQRPTERWAQPETRGNDGSHPSSPTVLNTRVDNASPQRAPPPTSPQWAPPPTSPQWAPPPTSPQWAPPPTSPQWAPPPTSPQRAPPLTSPQRAPPATSPQRRPEAMASVGRTQWAPANHFKWRPEMSTSFSSSAQPAPLETRANEVASPQQILDRSRQGPTSPRWAQPVTKGTESVGPQPPPKTRRSPASSPQRAPQVRGSEEDPQPAGARMNGTGAQATSKTPVGGAAHPSRPSETVADAASPQQVPDSMTMSSTTSPLLAPETQPVPGVASPKRVYSYSVILTGTSNVQPGTKDGSPSHGRSQISMSPPVPGPQIISPGFSPAAGTAGTQSTPEMHSSADPSSPQHNPESRPPVNPASPQHHLASKPPLPAPSGSRVGSSHPGPPSAVPTSLQYSAPKSSLYSGLSPVPEQVQNNGEAVSLSTSSSEPGPQSGPGLAPESALTSSPRRDAGSLSSLDPGLPAYRCQPPAPDSMSYLDSVSMMSGTMESLSLLDDASSLGSDSEINGMTYRRTDKYGFLGGNQFSGGTESALPVDVARQRELKWLDMFKHWDKWVSRRFQKVKLRCRKGIPSSLRAKAWLCLSNSSELIERNPGKFEELERNPGDPKWLDVIEKDLHRQFPFHEMFAARGGHGQQDLYRILKAYTIYRPDEGYCQAQAPVAAVLLMHMPAEQAFWCLVQICEKYLPGYYSAGLEAIQLDGEIFFALLRRASPMAYRHLKKYKIDPILYMTEWFMCIFSRTLPWSSVLRVWDMFFCEGVKIIFRVGLVLLRHTLGSVDKLRSCQGMYETMEKLRNLPAEYMHESFLVHEVSSLPVTEALIERENTTQLKKWRENRGELQYKPSRRLHGTRAVFEEHHRMNPPLTTSSSLLSLTSLRRGSKEDRWRGGGQKENPGFSPAHSIGNLAISSGIRAAPASAAINPSNNMDKHSKESIKGKGEKAAGDGKKPALGPLPASQVVSEGLHPALPSPTGNVMPLGDPKKAKDRKKDKELEKQRAKEQKEKERQDKEREKELEKQRAKEQKEKERLDKEREKRLQKERAKEESKLKKERKASFRKKEPAEVPPAAQEKGPGEAAAPPEKAPEAPDGASEPSPEPGADVLQDSYF